MLPGGELVADLALHAAEQGRGTAQPQRADDLGEGHARGHVTLYPPTWVTLHELAEQPDGAALFDVARIGGIRRYETVARRGSAGPLLLWDGDAAYEDASFDDVALDEAAEADTGGAASRHRLELGSLPWVYTRSG